MGISAMLAVGGLASLAGGIAAGDSSKVSMPTMTPTGQALNSANSSFLENILANPTAGMAPIASAGTQAIDNGYAGSADTISRMMASRGYGSSGEMGDTMYQTDLSRLGSLSQFQGSMAQLESNRQMQASGDANQELGINTGSTVSTPGAGLANGLTSLGSSSANLGILAMMSSMLGGSPSAVGSGIPGVSNQPGTIPGYAVDSADPSQAYTPGSISGGGTTEDLGW